MYYWLSGQDVMTDGDIRRAIKTYVSQYFLLVQKSMRDKPAAVEIGTRMEDALSVMEARKNTSLLIKDGEEIVGVVKK
jgi:arabinose-5-phosphate isomerase